jgi:hypothetical protein
MPPRVLLIVTRVIGLGDDAALLGAWGCAGNTGPWYFAGDGKQAQGVPPEGNAVVIVRGDPESGAGERIERAIQGTSADQLCLLVHPGGGGNAQSFIPGAWPRDHRLCSIRCAHAFSTQGDGSSIRAVLLELGWYAQGGNTRCFETLLKVILENCCLDDAGFLAVMRRVTEDQQYRTSLSLPAEPPAIGVRDPIATIIHDVVSYVDALLLDLETAQHDPEYWNEVRERNKQNLEIALDRLRFLVGEEGSDKAKAWAQRRGFPIKPVERCVLLSERAEKSEGARRALEKLKGLRTEQNVAPLRQAVAENGLPLDKARIGAVKEWLKNVVHTLEAFRERGRDEIQPAASAAGSP